VQIDLRPGRGLRRLFGDRDDPAALPQRHRRALEQLGADGIEHEIDRRDRVLEASVRPVDDLVSAEGQCCVHAVLGRGGDHVGAAPACELRRKVAYAASRPVDEHPLALVEPPVVEQPLPCAQRGERHCCALDVVERLRPGGKQVRGHGGVGGGDAVPVEAGERIYGLPNRNGFHPLGHRGDGPGELIGGDRRKTIEGPDLNVRALGLFGRLFRAVQLANAPLTQDLARHGLQPGWFDLLAALRRAGAPYELNPTQLMHTTMLSSGGMTKRLDRMAEAGLVERRPDPTDRRGTLVRLTRRGKPVIDRAIETHVANEERLLRSLSAADRRRLDDLLRSLLSDLERGGAPVDRGS